MNAGRWDANAWHRQARRRFEVRTGGSRRRVLKFVAASIVLGAVLGSAAVANMDSLGATEFIGVCHATGVESEPYVFLVVARDGFEHGHHRHHEADYFVDATANGCAADASVPAPTPELPDEGNVTEPEVPEGDAVTPPQEPPVPPTDEGTDDEAPAEPEPQPDENVTQPEEPELPPPGDVAVTQSAQQDEFEVVLTFLVTNVGDGVAIDATLQDTLPDVRRPWYLGGADASRCVLDGRSLECWFGDLGAEESRTVFVRTYTDRLPCGQALTNTAWASSEGDAEPRNDGSSASIAARAC